MDEKRLKESITRAVEGHCAHLHADPFLTQKVIREAGRKENIPVKRKMKFGVALALILMLVTATAVAAVLLTGMELIEQEAIPLAQGNDGEVRPVEEYTYEELQSIILAAQENGIYLDDDTSVMRALRMGEGYSEEETIMAICREAFGGLFYEWTVEERHWFQDMMIEIGWATENNYPLPGEDEMPSEEARAMAKQTIWDHYGADIPLDDPAFYRDQEDFHPGSETASGISMWTFDWTPATLDGATYWVALDGQGAWAEHSTAPAYSWEDYTEEMLEGRVDSVYNYRKSGSGMISWEYDAWYAFGQKLPGAKHSENWDEAYDGYLASTYLLPGENDLTKKQARDIAFADAGVKDYTSVTELLLGKGDQRIWKISFNTSEKTGMNQLLSYEIDSVTREILRKDELSGEVTWARYMLNETYESVKPDDSNVMSQEKAIELAVAALHKELGDDTIPYTDEQYYAIDARHNSYSGGYEIIFNTKVMEYGRASVSVDGNGKVSIWFANAPGVNGDNLFECYDDLYGSCFDWDQSLWVEFGQAMKQYAATTFEGKLFKQTTYVDASTVKLSKDDALDIVWKDEQADHICAILIGAEPNPVWKVRANTHPVTTLYEIDAMTGEILDKELYYIQMPNFDHEMKMYTLRKDFMPAHLAEFGVERVAMELCVKAFANEFEQYGDSPDVFTNKDAYTTAVDGMTVTFAARNPGEPSYRVTVGENAMSAEVEKIGNAEALSDSDPDLAAVYAQYGDNRRYWPIEMQYKYFAEHGYDLPREGEMTYEEALAYARKLIVDEVGQEEFDVMGDCHIGAHMIRYSDGVRVAWYFYFTDDPVTEENGWRVTFFLHDNVPSESYQVQPVKEYGNG